MEKKLSNMTRAELALQREEIYAEIAKLEKLIDFNQFMLQNVDTLLAGHNEIAAIFGNCRCEPCMIEKGWNNERLA